MSVQTLSAQEDKLLQELFEVPSRTVTRTLRPTGYATARDVKFSSITSELELFKLIFGVAPPKPKKKRKVEPKVEDQAAGSADGAGAHAVGAAQAPDVKREGFAAYAGVPLPQAAAAEVEEEEEEDFDVTFDEDLMDAPAPPIAPKPSAGLGEHDASAAGAGSAAAKPPPSIRPALQRPPGAPAAPPPVAGRLHSQSLNHAASAERQNSEAVSTVPGLLNAKALLKQGLADRAVSMNRDALAAVAAGGGPGGPKPPLLGGGAFRGSQYINVNTGLPTFLPPDAEWVFPSQFTGKQFIKLPKQTRVTPEEYKEFLSLGHGEIFSLPLEYVVERPWEQPTANPRDFFNYGLNMTTWREYCKKVEQYRAEFTMKNKIEVFVPESRPDRGFGGPPPHMGGPPPHMGGPPPHGNTGNIVIDPSIQPEIQDVMRKAAAASAFATDTQAISVLQDPDALDELVPTGSAWGGMGTDGPSRARTEEIRRNRVRLDPDAIIELVAPEHSQFGWVKARRKKAQQKAKPEPAGAAGQATQGEPAKQAEGEAVAAAAAEATAAQGDGAEVKAEAVEVKQEPGAEVPPQGAQDAAAGAAAAGTAAGAGDIKTDEEWEEYQRPVENTLYPEPAELQDRDKYNKFVQLKNVGRPLPDRIDHQHAAPGPRPPHVPPPGHPPGPRPPPGAPPGMPTLGGPGMPPLMGAMGMPPVMPALLMPPQMPGIMPGLMRPPPMPPPHGLGAGAPPDFGDDDDYVLDSGPQEPAQNNVEQMQPVQSMGFMDDLGYDPGETGAEGYEGYAEHAEGDEEHAEGDEGHEEGALHAVGEDAGFYGEDEEGGGGQYTEEVNPTGVLDLLNAGYAGEEEYQQQQQQAEKHRSYHGSDRDRDKERDKAGAGSSRSAKPSSTRARSPHGRDRRGGRSRSRSRERTRSRSPRRRDRKDSHRDRSRSRSRSRDRHRDEKRRKR